MLENEVRRPTEAPRSSGLEGVVVADTLLSHVDGEAGRLVIAGEDVERLAEAASFEDATARLWRAAELTVPAGLAGALAEARRRTFEQLSSLARTLEGRDPMHALASALGQLDLGRDPLAVLGATAVLVAAWARIHAGAAPLAPAPTRSHAADVLAMFGLPADPARARALDAYLVTVSDHGLNASTFTARVVASTGSELVSCIVAALCALEGPLHGGAPGPVLDMLDAVAARGDARAWLEAELDAGRRVMGMGHRIYRVRDPRALVLERAIERLDRELAETNAAGAAEIRARLALARTVERAAQQLLAERHPDRPLCANVEFYTAVLLEAVGVPRALFTAIFAVGRTAGWLAHVEEQRRTGRLVRPASRYVGPLPV